MKFSLESIKISIAGAKLSHLVQKDKIWDHGSMTEQARIIFYLVQKAKVTGNIESMKRQCSVMCFEKLSLEMKQQEDQRNSIKANSVIKQIAITEVQPGKKNKPDMFCALIRGVSKDDPSEAFVTQWYFIRQGDWWLLSEIKNSRKG